MKLKINKKQASLFLVIILGSFLVANFAWAQTTWVTDVIGWLCAAIVYALGQVLIQVMKAVIYVAQYSDFIHSPAITKGWIILRDVCNMFFVLILLVIAFATILKIENYSYKKYLPKLILMAILINFSKTICGLLIDVAQVVMLTFVNAFKTIGGGSLVDMLGITDWQNMSDEGQDVNDWRAMGAYVFAVIYVVVALITLITILAMLAMRIVMIWIYVVLSPLAYLLAAFPGGQSYASKWWSDFTKNLIVGPVLAFFIWLSFATVTPGSSGQSVLPVDGATMNVTGSGSIATSTTTGDFGTGDLLIKFVISIGMLVAGLKISQEIGGAAGSIAGKGMGAINKGVALGAGLGAGALALANKARKGGGNYLGRKISKGVGFDIRPSKLKEAFKANLEKSKRADEDAIRRKGKENLEAGGARSVFGGLGAGQDWAEYTTSGFLGLKGIRHAALEASGIRGNKRQRLGKDMGKVNKEIEALEKEKGGYITMADRNQGFEDVKDLKGQEATKDSEIVTLRTKIMGGSLEAGDSEKLAKLEKEKDALVDKRTKKEAEISSKDYDPDDSRYNAINDKLQAKNSEKALIKEKIFKAAPPQALETRLDYRKGINEAKTKYKDITNADELMKQFEDAKNRNNKSDQIAILEKLSGDANLNEILNGKGFSANAGGLYSFVNNLPNDRGESGRGLTGFSDAERLQLLNDLGESEERVNHWEMAKMAMMNDQGQMVSTVQTKKVEDVDASKGERVDGNYVRDKKGHIVFDDKEHVLAAAAEVVKGDPQKNVINLNRLAMGGEDANGEFQLSNLGRVLTSMFDKSGAFESQKGRIQNNLAINLSLPGIQEELRKIGVSEDTIKTLIAKSGVGQAEGASRSVGVKGVWEGMQNKI